MIRTSINILALLLIASLSMADENLTVPQDQTLFFREDWKEIPAETPVTQEHISNTELTLQLHGPSAELIKKSHHDNIENDPWYIWSGQCNQGNWALSLSKDDELVNLSNGWLRWRVKQSGPHILRVIVQLNGGSWWVSQQGYGATPDWHTFAIPFSEFSWNRLDIETVEAAEETRKIDLSAVKAVGWTDLKQGNGSPACTRVDWIEVYGKADSGK